MRSTRLHFARPFILCAAITLTSAVFAQEKDRWSEILKRDDVISLKLQKQQILKIPKEQWPILEATRHGAVKSLNWMLNLGAKVQASDALGMTALHIAAQSDRVTGEVTNSLLQHGASIRRTALDDYSPLDVAMEQRNRVFVTISMKYLLRKALGARDTKGHLAYRRAHLQNAELGALWLNYAVMSGDKRLLDQVLQDGAKPDIANRSGHYALSLAASWGEEDMLATLLSYGANPNRINDNRYQTTALMESTRVDAIDIAQQLLSHGAQVNMLDRHQDHALNWAVFFGRLRLVELLLKYGADVQQIGKQSNDNAMDIALRQGFSEIVEALRLAGAHPSRSTKGKHEKLEPGINSETNRGN